MERIGNYGGYAGAYEQSRVGGERSNTRTAASGEGASASRGESRVSLSSSAKNLLKELQKSYGNMDFIVADFETDEEAASYLARGTGGYSVLLTPDELEKMAADEEYKKKNLKTLDNAVAKLDDMKKELGSKGEDVKRIGIVLGDDGEVSYFAELEKSGEKQRERIDRQRADRREEAADARKKAERERLEAGQGGVKRTMVYASSEKELADKIRNVDWNAVKEGNTEKTGSRFDLTI